MFDSVFYATKIKDEYPERERRVCSNCGARYRAPVDDFGTTCPLCVTCESCGKPFQAQPGEHPWCPDCRRPE